ncbi:hypothetical protein FB451DRAFT_1180491 [Mycena latifolia]|nr:hypothetical protein FB451DRAFT_1180491 [Mycena latifolia]
MPRPRAPASPSHLVRAHHACVPRQRARAHRVEVTQRPPRREARAFDTGVHISDRHGAARVAVHVRHARIRGGADEFVGVEEEESIERGLHEARAHRGQEGQRGGLRRGGARRRRARCHKRRGGGHPPWAHWAAACTWPKTWAQHHMVFVGITGKKQEQAGDK